MNRRIRFALPVVFIFAAGMAPAGDADQLAEPLRPFAPFLGKTWKGEFANSTAAKPVFDVARWERALNGKAVRVLHSVNDGAYGGETIIAWDANKKCVAYWYFTTAGFRTEGTMKHDDGHWTAHEIIAGAASGIPEVKSVSRILPDGRLHVKAEYLKDGKWGVGREVH